ncbi:MAG: SoxR reducing system RseC family protein [Spirochaetales bacterium]|nr:SoxR reducing system RseC family protein [Spirochaetales bacterium]
MKERGIATKVDGNSVTVLITVHEGCESCDSRDSCSSIGHELLADTSGALAIAIGDTVDIEVPDSVRAAGALWLLAVPLALFFAGYLGVGSMFPGTSEGPQALAGLVGLAGGVLIATVVARRSRLSMRPTATKVNE